MKEVHNQIGKIKTFQMLENQFLFKIQVMMIIKDHLRKNFYQQMEECMVWLEVMLKEMFNIWKIFNQQLKILPKITFLCNKILEVWKNHNNQLMLKIVIKDKMNILKDFNRDNLKIFKLLNKVILYIMKKELHLNQLCVKVPNIIFMMVL